MSQITTTDWAAYVGMVTGIVGAITGIAGAIMGYVSYKRSNKLKSLDLRLELRKAVTELQASLSQAQILIRDANKSRQAVAAAMGMFQSGRMEQWKQQVAADTKTTEQLLTAAPSFEGTFAGLDAEDLESKLVEVHKLTTQADGLSEKYQASLRADDEERRHIREDTRARINTQPPGSPR